MTALDFRMQRRALLAQAGMAGAALLASRSATWAAAPADPVVETSSGKIKGFTADGIAGFKGVPYGASTAGANRFMPPKKPEPWTGVRDAVAWAGHAPQASPGPRRPELAKLSGEPDRVPESEDCLTLNVWTPGLDNAKRPVMVWFHGGAFSYGSPNVPRTDGANLARRGDVVVVTVNHRLNIFGFLYLAEIGGERFARSGNAGVLDLVASLEWVRDNIARFGGDPGNVTIFGQSGGGGKVSAVLAMPAAKGLFHRAIVMSGAGIRMATKEHSAKIAEAVLAQVELKPNELDKLQQLPVKQLLSAIEPALKKVGRPEHSLLDRYGFGPVVGGHDLPQHPFEPSATEISGTVPIIVGGTKDENAIFLAADDAVWNRTLSAAELKARVAKIAGGDTEAVLTAYRKTDPAMNPAELLITITTASNFWVRSVLLAERKAVQHQAPVFMYSFDWETPVFDGKLRSPHAIDVPFVFDTTDVVNNNDHSATVQKIAAAMSATWAAFARTGVPDNSAIPHWPAYDLRSRTTMTINGDWKAESDPAPEARLMWKKIALA